MKLFRILSVLLVVGLLTTGCGQAAAPGGTIKVGILAPLSGPAPTYGTSHRDAAQLAIDEWNAKGGVLGKQIEAVVVDSQCAADPSVNAANKLIDQDGVHYLIGEVCSKASIPASEVAESKGVVMITPSSTAEGVTVDVDGKTKSYVFRACFINSFQGKVMARFAKDQGFTKAFIMSDIGNDYVRSLAEAFEKTWLENGGEVVGKESYSSADTDFSAILTKVAESGAEVLYLPDYYNITNLVAAQAKEKGATAVIMGGDAWDSADLNLEAAEGSFFSNFYSQEDPRPEVQDWVKKFTEKYGAAPDSIATMAYDATNMLLAAIEKAGADDADKVKDALAEIEFQGVTGTIVFDEFHNPIKPAAVLQVKDGRVVFVEMVTP